MLSSITQNVRNATRWLGSQVVDNDFGARDDKAVDYALIGAGLGAAAGAAVGTMAGFKAQAANSIKEVWVDRTITHPELNGWSHWTSEDSHEECTGPDDDRSCTTEIDGWWHHYSPDITNRVVGHYTEPTFQNTKFMEPLLGGLLGAVGGGAIGLAAGIGAAAIQRSLQKGEERPRVKMEPEVRTALSEKTGIAMLAGGAVGVGVGAYLGAQAGHIELASQEIHTRSWDIPVTHNETIGYIPSDYYEHNWVGWGWPSSGSGRSADDPVVRAVPDYDRAGDPKLTGTSHTFETNRYGPVFGGIAGGVMGAGVGLAVGVALGVGQKLLTEHNLEKQAEKAKDSGKTAAA